MVRPVGILSAPEADRQRGRVGASVAPTRRVAVIVLVAVTLLLLAVVAAGSEGRVGLFQQVSTDGGPDAGRSHQPADGLPLPGATGVPGSPASGTASDVLSTPPVASVDAEAGNGEGDEVVVGNRSTVDIEVDGGAGDKVKVTNEGSATASTGGNTVIGSSSDGGGGSASLKTGKAVAVGNDATTSVRVKP